MKHKKWVRSVSFSIFLLSVSSLQAQETILSTGGEAIGSGGNVSYSVGQVGYATQTGTNGSVELGVQQPFLITTSSGFELTTIKLELTAYPNPTQNSITLKVEDYQQEKLNYQLFDLQGRLLKTGQVTVDKTNINMDDLPASTYFFKVEEENQIIKTFSIIKN